jgi:hypothetical protein
MFHNHGQAAPVTARIVTIRCNACQGVGSLRYR